MESQDNQIKRADLWHTLTDALTYQEGLLYSVDRSRLNNKRVNILLIFLVLLCGFIPTIENYIITMPPWLSIIIGVITATSLVFKEYSQLLMRKDEDIVATDKLIKEFSLISNDLERLWNTLQSNAWTDKCDKDFKKYKKQIAEKKDEVNKAIPYLSKRADKKIQQKVTKYMNDKFRTRQ